MYQLTAYLLIIFSLSSLLANGENNLNTYFEECGVDGSITIYHSESNSWIYSDSTDAERETLPASTFKIPNSLIALERSIIADEHEIMEWDGTENTFFGNRIDAWNQDTDMITAFRTSAIWFYERLAYKIGKEYYKQFLDDISYGNSDFSEPGDDFWNFGSFGISPVNQIHFLKNFYREKLPVSNESVDIVKGLMVIETTEAYTLSGKTGWTKTGEIDIGWLVGYVEKDTETWFFATRITKPLIDENPNFSSCRASITTAVLKNIGVLESLK
jgi:beta-lactamase class D